jgi:hypothetical protein
MRKFGLEQVVHLVAKSTQVVQDDKQAKHFPELFKKNPT